MCTLRQDLDRLRQCGAAGGHAHLDALQRILQLPAVQLVVEALGRSAKACPVVDDTFALLFVLAMGLFPSKSYRNVARRLIPAAAADRLPSRATLAAARRRLGAEPVRALIQSGLPPLVAEVSREVLPLRVPRNNPRVVKCPRVKWPAKKTVKAPLPQPDRPFKEAIALVELVI